MIGLIRLNLVLAIVFLAAAIGLPAYYHSVYPEPPLLQNNQEFRRNVDSIKDIEHLRKVLYTVVVGTDKSMIAEKGFSDAAVRLLAVIAGVAAAGFGVSCMWLYALRRKKGEQ